MGMQLALASPIQMTRPGHPGSREPGARRPPTSMPIVTLSRDRDAGASRSRHGIPRRCPNSGDRASTCTQNNQKNRVAPKQNCDSQREERSPTPGASAPPTGSPAPLICTESTAGRPYCPVPRTRKPTSARGDPRRWRGWYELSLRGLHRNAEKLHEIAGKGASGVGLVLHVDPSASEHPGARIRASPRHCPPICVDTACEHASPARRPPTVETPDRKEKTDEVINRS